MRLLTIALFIVIVNAQTPAASQPGDGANQKTETDKQQKAAPDSQAPGASLVKPLPGIVSQPDSKAGKENADKKAEQIWEKAFAPETWGTWCLVVLAFGATVAAIRTLGVIERQTTAIERQGAALINSERAWVVVSKVWRLNLQPGLNEFMFDLTNRGRTVARLAGFKETFRVVPSGKNKLPDTPNYGTADDLLGQGHPIHGRVLAPEEVSKKISFRSLEPLNSETIADIHKRTTSLYFYASLKYFDFADQERELQFCYVYLVDGDGTSGQWIPGGPKEYNKHT